MPTNTAEGGTDTVTVTAANSGGASGKAFDTVTIGDASATLIFDSTHAAHGSLGYKFQLGAVAAQLFLQWLASVSASNIDRLFIKFNSYWTANPSGSAYQLHVASAGAAQVCGVRINTSGQLIIVNQAGSTIGTMTSAIPLNAWFRVEVDAALDGSGTNVVVNVRRYDNIDSAQPNDQVTATGATAVPFSRVRFGWGGTATANIGPWWMDDLEVRLPDGAVDQPDTFLPDATLLALDSDDTAGESPLGYLYVPWPAQIVDAAPSALTGDATTTVTAGLTADGTVATFGDAATTVTATLTATGTVGVSSGAATTVTATLTASGTAVSGGAASTTITATLTATGNVATSSGAATTITATLAAAGTVGKLGAAASTITTTLAATATVGKSSGAATTVTATLAATGSVSAGLSSGAATTITASLAATGSASRGGAAAAVFTAALTASGTSSAVIVPLTVTGSDRPSSSVTGQSTLSASVTGTDSASSTVTGTATPTATVSGSDRSTSTVTSS